MGQVLRKLLLSALFVSLCGALRIAVERSGSEFPLVPSSPAFPADTFLYGFVVQWLCTGILGRNIPKSFLQQGKEKIRSTLF